MNSFDDGIRFEQKQTIRQFEIENGAIVARSDDNGLVCGKRSRKAGDEFKFVHG